jgi:hypothetical protein
MSIDGQVADQVVGQGLKIAEVAAKLTGWGMKNLAALLMALYQENKDILKKPSLQDIMSDPNPPGIVPIKRDEVDNFKREAKAYTIKPFIVDDGKGDTVDVVVAGKHAKTVNRILEKMGYAERYNTEAFHQEDIGSKNADPLVPQENALSEQGNISEQKNSRETTSSDEPPSIVAKVEGIKAEQAKQSPDKSAPALDKSATTAKAER